MLMGDYQARHYVFKPATRALKTVKIDDAAWLLAAAGMTCRRNAVLEGIAFAWRAGDKQREYHFSVPRVAQTTGWRRHHRIIASRQSSLGAPMAIIKPTTLWRYPDYSWHEREESHLLRLRGWHVGVRITACPGWPSWARMKKSWRVLCQAGISSAFRRALVAWWRATSEMVRRSDGNFKMLAFLRFDNA